MKANTPRHWFMSVRLTWQAAIVQICLKMPDAALNMPRALQKCDSQNIKNNNNNYNKPTINPPAASMKACMNDAVSQCSAQWTWFTGLLWGYNVLINESTAEIQIRFIYCTDYKWRMRLLDAIPEYMICSLSLLFLPILPISVGQLCVFHRWTQLHEQPNVSSFILWWDWWWSRLLSCHYW